MEAPNLIPVFLSGSCFEKLSGLISYACKSREILMFVCLQKDAKQCCDATKLNHTHCAGQQKMPNSSMMPQILIILILLVSDN